MNAAGDIEPRHDAAHHDRILCGRADCCWPIATTRRLDNAGGDWPTGSIFPTVPVGAFGVDTDATGRQLVGAVWEPTKRTLQKTARVLKLLGVGAITREEASWQGRPGARSDKRRAGVVSFEVLRVPCGVRCPACLTVNRFARWSLQSGLA